LVDVRKLILKSIEENEYEALITVDRKGILAGIEESKNELDELDMKYKFNYKNGERVNAGDVICSILGKAGNIIKVEEIVIGKMAKASGIATATDEAVKLAQSKCKVVAGAWKKLPKEVKAMVQKAVRIGGASTRLIEEDFIYLDKNYVRMFGGIKNALEAVGDLTDYKKVVQLKGEDESIEKETLIAIRSKADVIMVDTGEIEDLIIAKKILDKYSLGKKIRIGFASDLLISKIPEYIQYGADFLCYGKQIIDAPLLDMKLDVKERIL
jgi:nicotinate-nucleotide pyrophosphorylase (carboxylating)